MSPLSRRQALQLAGFGVASAAVGAGGLLWPRDDGWEVDPGDPLREPEVLRSRDGTLRVPLEVTRGPVRIGGREATAYGYNGGVPGPTLRVRPGDRLRVDLANRLDAATNLHVHGLHVSPEGNGDNVFLSVQPGETFGYDHQLPEDHPPGVYWYHPHHHGNVADQVFGGLYGAIVVEDPDPPPVTRERVLVISDISLDPEGRLRRPSLQERMMGREGQLVLVDGQVRPTMTARPGERERWRIVNACVSRFVRLRLDGQQLQLLGIDSGRFPRPRDVEEVVLVTGNQADLLVTATEGTSSLEAFGVDRGGMGPMAGFGLGPGVSGDAGTVATFRVTGETAPELPAVPARTELPDLRGEQPAAQRRLTLDMGVGMGMGGRGGGMGGGRMGPGGMSFTIDGREFDADRIDQSVTVGTVEEWTISNTSPMDHPMHLHVFPMQVVAERGRPVQDVRWQDVVNVPADSDVTVRVAFDRFPGRTVYHCHILDHEDNGMMGVLQARPAG